MVSRCKLGALIALSVGAFALTACGVRGSLEPPPEAKAEPSSTPGQSGQQPPPHKPSVLDGLLR
jgi:predicted small lipoprotein YifL